MAEENLSRIDVEKRTTRGRVCPRCEGKIIPSDRAVYQSAADPTGAFPIWQCERCGYEGMSERATPEGKAKDSLAEGSSRRITRIGQETTAIENLFFRFATSASAAKIMETTGARVM